MGIEQSVEWPQPRCALSYCPAKRPVTLIDQELSEFISDEGGRGEYFFPDHLVFKSSDKKTIISDKRIIILPCGSDIVFCVNDVLVDHQNNWMVLSVQIDGKPENLLIALIYDYLQEYWRTREEIFPWLKGQADLSIKV
jgi:hypothetical protein